MNAEEKELQSWQHTTLGNLFQFKGGGTPSKKNPDYWGGNIPWASVKDIKNQYLTTTIDTITQAGLNESAANLASPGDLILLTRIEPGKVAIVKKSVAVNQDCKIVTPLESVDLVWSYYLFRSLENEFIKRSSGTTVLGIRLNDVKEIPVTLPSFEEQKRIAAKIEELFSELDNGIAALKTAHEQLKVYRQSLLKHAFEGKLTEQWRKDNLDKLESPEQLLTRIQQEREARYQQKLEEWKQAVKEWDASGKDGKKPKTPSKPDVLNISNTRARELLPETWCWMQFGDLITIASNLVSPLDYQNLPHIAPDNIERDTGRLLSYKMVEEDGVTSPKHYFYAGQIIYSKIRPNLSKLTHVDFDGLCSADMYPLQSDCYNHVFLKYLMLTKDFVTQASTAGSRSVLPKINQTELSRLLVPLCGLHEQRQIVNQLEKKLSIIEQNEKEVEAALAKAELLRQSILKRAFSGKLLV